MEMETTQRLHVLRNYENFCYQVCFYLLQNEALATESAKQALLELYKHADFFNCSNNEKKDIIYKFAVKKSLQATASYELRA